MNPQSYLKTIKTDKVFPEFEIYNHYDDYENTNYIFISTLFNNQTFSQFIKIDDHIKSIRNYNNYIENLIKITKFNIRDKILEHKIYIIENILKYFIFK